MQCSIQKHARHLAGYYLKTFEENVTFSWIRSEFGWGLIRKTYVKEDNALACVNIDPEIKTAYN